MDHVPGAPRADTRAAAVARALLPAAPTLVSALGFLRIRVCRDESRHGTHECVRHAGMATSKQTQLPRLSLSIVEHAPAAQFS